MSDSSTASSNSLTYHSVLQTLSNLGERSKKHRKNGSAKAMDNVLADMEHLLFCLKHHTMQSESPSARVIEAQVWMNKAAMEKVAGRAEDEASAYLTAAGLWMAIESERRDLNFMTSGDALARAVLCCAMACNVLLTLKPNIASSPLPIKLTKMLNVHLSRAWSICIRLAHQLSHYSCLEMSADYFELAAILVTIDPVPSSSSTNSTAASTKPVNGSFTSASNANNNNVTPMKMTTPTSNSVTHRTQGTPLFQDPSLTSPAAAQNIAAAMTPPVSQQASPTQSIRTRGTASVLGGGGGNTATYRADRVFTGTVYGVDIQRGQAPPVQILNGFLAQYIVALSSCAMTCALVQDYPRCLTIVDDLLQHLVGIERSRRPQLIPSWLHNRHAAHKPAAELSGGDDRTEADDQGENSRPAPLTAEEISAVDVLPTEVSSNADTDGPLQQPDERAIPPAVAAAAPTVAMSNQSFSQSASTSFAVAAAAVAGQPPTSCAPAAAPWPLAPPPGGSLHAHNIFTPLEHFMFLLETESTYISMRLVKFLVLIVLRDPQLTPAGTREQVTALFELATLYNVHSRFTTAAVGRPPIVDRGSSSAFEHEDKRTFSGTLFRLAVSLEVIVESFEEYPSARRGHTPAQQEAMVVHAFEEVQVLSKALGCYSRNAAILLQRARKAMLFES